MGHAPPLNQGIKALYQGAMAFIRADALCRHKKWRDRKFGFRTRSLKAGHSAEASFNQVRCPELQYVAPSFDLN
jgi:hypothetical protein